MKNRRGHNICAARTKAGSSHETLNAKGMLRSC
jgi:hypothetical protein